jgi:hypothetical protein
MKSYEFESGAQFAGGTLLGRIDVEVTSSAKGSGVNKGKFRNVIQPVKIILKNKVTGAKTASVREYFNSKNKLETGVYNVGIFESEINGKLIAYLAL